MTLLAKINETAAFLKGKGMEAPEFGLILGSGLGELAEEIENPVVVDYSEIPNWGRSTVVGHAGKLVYGDLAAIGGELKAAHKVDHALATDQNVEV